MRFSWKRGLLHAAIPFVLLLLGGGVLVATDRVVHVEAFSEGMGRFGVFVILVGLLISYLVQTGRRRAAFGVGLGLVALFGMLAAIAVSPPHHAARLPIADRGSLIAFDDHGQRRLRHPTFGFSILHPGPAYAESAAITQAMRAATADDLQTVYYGFAETPPTTALVVGVFSDAGGSRADFQQVVDGIARSTREQFPAGAVTVPKNEVIWTDAKREGHFHAVIAGAGHFYVSAYAVHPADRPAFVVALIVVTPVADTLSDVLTSFRP